MVINRQTKACTQLTLTCLAATVFACGTLQSQPGFTIVPISSINQLTGKWEGLSKRLPDMQDDARVILIVSENGHFNFASNRATELLLGTGTLRIHDGEAFGKTGTGSGTLTLHNKAGKPLLVVEVSLNDGHHYYLEMTRLTD